MWPGDLVALVGLQAAFQPAYAGRNYQDREQVFECQDDKAHGVDIVK